MVLGTCSEVAATTWQYHVLHSEVAHDMLLTPNGHTHVSHYATTWHATQATKPLAQGIRCQIFAPTTA